MRPQAEQLTWTLELPGLHATDDILFADWDGGPRSLARFFSELGASWRGWTGTLEWTGGGGEAHLSATHDGIGHVELTVAMRVHWNGQPPYPDQWTARGVIALEPGSLEETAGRIGELLGV